MTLFPRLPPIPWALAQTLQLRSPNPGPVLCSRTHRRKRPAFLPGPRRAQRLDRRARRGRISGKPRVKQRSRHPAGQTRRLRLMPEVFLPLGPPPFRKTRVRATGFSQSGAPRGESWVTRVQARAPLRRNPRRESGPFFLLEDFPRQARCCGLRWWLSGKESDCQCRRLESDPWVGKVGWRRAWLPTPVFLFGESHGQRSLGGL